LFSAGETALLGQPGLAVVGSRNVNETGQRVASLVGNACARCGLVLYSGGARGVDSLATQAALEARGSAVGILADSLEKAIRAPDARAALALLTPYAPNAGFSVGAAMGRNRPIYVLADYALVVSSGAEKAAHRLGQLKLLRPGGCLFSSWKVLTSPMAIAFCFGKGRSRSQSSLLSLLPCYAIGWKLVRPTSNRH